MKLKNFCNELKLNNNVILSAKKGGVKNAEDN